MDYPIRYVKGDRRQWAGTPAAAVALEFAGWRPEAAAPDQAGGAEPLDAGAAVPDAATAPEPDADGKTRPKRNKTEQS